MSNAIGSANTGPHPVGEKVRVKNRNGSTFVEIWDLPPSVVVVLTNRA